MQGRFEKTVFALVGTFVLWCTTIVLQAFAREGPNRANAVQLPLLVLVLGAPALSYVLRRRQRWAPVSLLVVQLGSYVLYETGISIETNIRADVLLIYPAILLNAWIARRAGALEAGGKSSLDLTWISQGSDDSHHVDSDGSLVRICKK